MQENNKHKYQYFSAVIKAVLWQYLMSFNMTLSKVQFTQIKEKKHQQIMSLCTDNQNFFSTIRNIKMIF